MDDNNGTQPTAAEEEIEFVYRGRYWNRGTLTHEVHAVDGDQLIGKSRLYNSPPAGRGARPGQVYRTTGKRANDGGPMTLLLSGAEYVRFWHDHDAVQQWQATDQTAASMQRLSRLRAEEAIDELAAALTPFRDLYSRSAPAERVTLLAVLIAAATNSMATRDLRDAMRKTDRKTGR